MKSDAVSLSGINAWQLEAQFRWSDNVVATCEVNSGNLVLDKYLVCHLLSQAALSSHCFVLHMD